MTPLYIGTPTTAAIKQLILEGEAFRKEKKVDLAAKKFQQAHLDLKRGGDLTTEKQIFDITLKVANCLALKESAPLLKAYTYEALRISRKLHGEKSENYFNLSVRFIKVCAYLNDYRELERNLSAMREICSTSEEKEVVETSLAGVQYFWQAQLKKLDPEKSEVPLRLSRAILPDDKQESAKVETRKILALARQFLADKKRAEKAKEQFEMAIKVARQLHPNDLLVAECLISFASRSRMIEKVRTLLNEAAPICEFHGEKKLLYDGWINTGKLMIKKEEAQECYKMASNYCDDRTEVDALLNGLVSH